MHRKSVMVKGNVSALQLTSQDTKKDLIEEDDNSVESNKELV